MGMINPALFSRSLKERGCSNLRKLASPPSICVQAFHKAWENRSKDASVNIADPSTSDNLRFAGTFATDELCKCQEIG